MDIFSQEHINPFDAESPDFWMKIEHLGRYLFAARTMRKNGVQGPVLDIGCANGYGLAHLAHGNSPLTGIDYDAELLEAAQKELPNGHFIQADLDKTPLSALTHPHAPYALITAFEVLEHLNTPQDVLKAATSLLKPGGVLVLSVPNPRFENVDESGNPQNPFHHHAFTLNDIENLAQKAGLKVVQVLGQAVCNILFHRERHLVQSGVKDAPHFSHPNYQKPENIDYMARLFAWPDEEALEKSYSYILVCKVDS